MLQNAPCSKMPFFEGFKQVTISNKVQFSKLKPVLFNSSKRFSDVLEGLYEKHGLYEIEVSVIFYFQKLKFNENYTSLHFRKCLYGFSFFVFLVSSSTWRMEVRSFLAIFSYLYLCKLRCYILCHY